MRSSRRYFLKQLGSGLLIASSPTLLLAAKDRATQTVILYGARTHIDGQHYLSAVSERGELLFNQALPARAHEVILRPSENEVVVFARRPGQFIGVFNAQTGEIKHQLSMEESRPLCGHGVFSQDGSTLLTTENDFQNKQGMIGVRDARDGYKKVAEFPSGGIGPHELKFLSDNKTLVVANGGILTHPDTGRSKLNLDTMTPSLSYLEVASGALLDDFRLAQQHHQLSIRHLDVTAMDEVCFAMQYQGSRLHQYPLVGFHRGESALQLVMPPKPVLKRMKNYCGSVRASVSGNEFAVSSPRGNIVTLWSRKGEYLGNHKINDGCGIARAEQGFYVSNGQGSLQHYQQKTSETFASFADYRWDNHLLAVGGVL